LGNSDRNFFATAPKGLEGLLADELRELGGADCAERRAGAVFSGTLETAYRACLWSRIANRILMPLLDVAVTSADELYQAVQTIDWQEHLGPDDTLAVDFSGRLADINHTHYGALRVKDAIVDQFRANGISRPSIDTKQPSLRVNVYLHRGRVVISLDLSGDSLHRRGYRAEGGRAPLKENLAAAILRRAGWPSVYEAGGAFVDPMCGSGTFTIEAGMIAADIAPGLLRDYWGFSGWRGHRTGYWENILKEAEERKRASQDGQLRVYGFDADKTAIRVARKNAELAGLSGRARFEYCVLEKLQRPKESTGLLAVNPPYGERLGDIRALHHLYAQLGGKLLQEFCGWKAAVLTGSDELGRVLGLRAYKVNSVYNGALECRLLLLDIAKEKTLRSSDPIEQALRRSEQIMDSSDGARMFANRLRKNLRTIGKWAEREGISCYRLYDADIPEYAAAIDIYQDWVHVQEYDPPRSVELHKAAIRLKEMLAVIAELLQCPHDHMVLKRRVKQRGGTQYEKLDDAAHYIPMQEQGIKLLVNLHDYLDTGLFLDHRKTRAMIRKLAHGRSFLNLFSYTGSATVYAAAGGARATTSVDMSHTYLEWTRRNLAVNGIRGRQHELIQSDCLEWLKGKHHRYDLIFLDPPTFSRSKRMRATFDVQRDHIMLLERVLSLLAKDGTLLFSCNRRGFKLDKETILGTVPGIKIEDITRATLPRDFSKTPPVHQCWKIHF